MVLTNPQHTCTQTPSRVWEKSFPPLSFLSQRKTALHREKWHVRTICPRSRTQPSVSKTINHKVLYFMFISSLHFIASTCCTHPCGVYLIFLMPGRWLSLSHPLLHHHIIDTKVLCHWFICYKRLWEIQNSRNCHTLVRNKHNTYPKNNNCSKIIRSSV